MEYRAAGLSNSLFSRPIIAGLVDISRDFRRNFRFLGLVSSVATLVHPGCLVEQRLRRNIARGPPFTHIRIAEY